MKAGRLSELRDFLNACSADKNVSQLWFVYDMMSRYNNFKNRGTGLEEKSFNHGIYEAFCEAKNT